MNKKQNQNDGDMRPALSICSLSVKLFADGADKAGMLEMAAKPFIKGLTTNPTLMRKAGITDYKSFALDVLKDIPDKPISFEVFSDDFEEMERQAIQIAGWGENVYVKIPITNTQRQSACDQVGLRRTHPQVSQVAKGLHARAPRHSPTSVHSHRAS
jgi:hypothetical protein